MKDHNLFSVIPYKDHFIKFAQAKKAFAYTRSTATNLLTGESFSFPFEKWIQEFRTEKVGTAVSSPRMMHLFYELGFLIEAELDALNDDDLLLIDLHFESFEKIQLQKTKAIKLSKKSFPQKELYKKSFEEGYAELLKGNCYQFNLTAGFDYSFSQDYSPWDFISALWEEENFRGRFASATYIPFFKKLFLSNSPECLFQLEGNTLSSMPIKGTVKLEGQDWKPLWKEMKKDTKSQAELFMIADLLRNDLSRIEKPVAKIVKKKSPKLVPGLLHQYAKINVELSNNVELWKIIQKVFPGGSITGAPKVRAMRLLHRLEKRQRRFYCGSTVLLFKNLKAASINIRAAEIDFCSHLLHYQAGGGITLKSQMDEEFLEMTYKHDSFIRTLTVENC